VEHVAPILEVRDLQTHFYTRAGIVRAVDGVSFSINPGETLGIVGESGCGKSVTVMSLMRLIPTPPGRIVGGEVLLHDGGQTRDLLKLPESAVRDIRGNVISMIFQDPMVSLNPVLTVGYQIAEPLIIHRGMTPAAARKHVVELLEQVGIPAAARRVDDYPHQFSGGMRQRVMIAIAMACRPKLLIADEPTTALDVTIQAQILDLIVQLNRDHGTAVILITHDLGVVAELCKRVIVMYAGRVIESASADRLYNAPQHPYTSGLMRSVPRLGPNVKERLVSIKGMPPDLIAPPEGCRFRPRCPRPDEQCKTLPDLSTIEAEHLAACWYPGPV
jgi:oligopeptide/dipeptide ABC transporter ATP-binding protein